ncbi:MAG: enoyl-CoA hydratase/isomerase family protein [Leucobacter sp.]|nr:enoyl-CoA hydratase/isomerase family protein [Leucobacter sp.]
MTDSTATNSSQAEPTVIVRAENRMTRITLNRPRALNALTRDMVVQVRAALSEAATQGADVVVLEGAGERGFCGGGDVKSMSSDGLEAALEFLSQEYLTDFAIHTSPIAVVGIMHGITMGGGIGLTAHAATRVVTERSLLSMPETRIGIAPDVGGDLLLARCPGRLGELLAISSGTFNGQDAIALGFADHYVPSDRLDELTRRLASGESPEAVCAALAVVPPASTIVADHTWFDEIADSALGSAEVTLADPVAATARLLEQLETSQHEGARQLATTVRGLCPMSVVVSIAQIARVRRDDLDLATVLADAYRTLGRLLPRPDFAEGVRALLIDRDGTPHWQPARVEDLDPAAVRAILDPEPVAGETPLDVRQQAH